MSGFADLGVGDTVFIKRNDHPGGHDAVITAIARKWATMGDHGRFDRATGALDGGRYSSNGRVYPTRADWETETALSGAWTALRREITYCARPPAGITLADLADIRTRLGLATETP